MYIAHFAMFKTTRELLADVPITSQWF